jgi:hypothetical protein
MNIIENLFGLSPDGGSGLLEAAVFIAILAIAAIALRRRFTGFVRRRLTNG